ncbi:MAG: bifunctional DNA primase/polymerase [Alphaproteobacteria bacterium]|nr:bifunctional DNA primase/polymerase [Alphaproteobacteria bacterium]
MARGTVRPRPPDAEPPALAAALDYLRRGFSVLPLRPREKRPILEWEAMQHAAPAEAELRRWFAKWPDANIGIVTGRVSGLVVVDVDPKHGGADALAAEERRSGPMPPAPEVLTGGGGRHLYFQHPGYEVANRAGVLPGIDVRGDGGYVVAPPSIHPSGRPYVWRAGHGLGERPLAILPRWLARPAGRGGRSLQEWRALVREGVGEGQRNSTIASLCGHLLWHGVDAEVALDLLLAWNRAHCRPPLPDEEVARVVASIAHLHEAEPSRRAPWPSA